MQVVQSKTYNFPIKIEYDVDNFGNKKKKNLSIKYE